MNWFEAKDHCKTEGGYLVEIDSMEENNALVEEIKRKGFSKRLFWIGMTDRGSEGDWILETSGSKPSYLNWGRGEPDGGQKENCALVWNNEHFGGKWCDVPCDMDNIPYKSMHALCEFKESGDCPPLILENVNYGNPMKIIRK